MPNEITINPEDIISKATAFAIASSIIEKKMNSLFGLSVNHRKASFLYAFSSFVGPNVDESTWTKAMQEEISLLKKRSVSFPNKEVSLPEWGEMDTKREQSKDAAEAFFLCYAYLLSPDAPENVFGAILHCAGFAMEGILDGYFKEEDSLLKAKENYESSLDSIPNLEASLRQLSALLE